MLVRRAGIGRLMLQARSARSIGIPALLSTAISKHRLLPRILDAPPLACSANSLEVRMLLHRKRFLEGMWALYSFAWHCKKPLRIIVHSDGSLDDECAHHLSRVFPGITLVDKKQADEAVNADLQARGLKQCLEWRRRSVFARKVLDFISMSKAECYLIIDSDILTFGYPKALVEDPEDNTKHFHVYSLDNNDDSYALPPDVLEARTGRPALRRLNAGIMKIRRDRLDIADFERCFEETDVLNDPDSKQYYVEQAAYACILGKNGTIALDETKYTVCGDPNSVIIGHYCGGGYWATRFYREGLPYLTEKIRI